MVWGIYRSLAQLNFNSNVSFYCHKHHTLKHSYIRYRNNNNNNNNVIYIAPFTMYSRRLGESRKKMRFKFVFEPVLMIDSTDTARQPIPKMRPSYRKGTIAHLFFGARDLKCNGQIRKETVFSFVDTKLKIWRQITKGTKMESFKSLDSELEKNPLLDWEPMEGL